MRPAWQVKLQHGEGDMIKGKAILITGAPSGIGTVAGFVAGQAIAVDAGWTTR
jgi:hypothetical protein